MNAYEIARAEATRVVEAAYHKAVAAGELPEGSMFIQDLIGLPVLCEGKTLGKVKEVLQLPANDVYVVEGEQEYMIPAVPEFILERNPDEGFIRVRLLEGMQSDAV